MCATSRGASPGPPFEKPAERHARLPDHHVVALLESAQQDSAHAEDGFEPINGIWLGVAAGTVLWLLLVVALVMA